MPSWLPTLIYLNSHGGNWDRYLDAVYGVFCLCFIGTNLTFNGKRVGLKRHPVEKGKEATFWHLISDGKIEEDRVPDMRRCERIGWPRAIIDNCGDRCLKTWSELVNGKNQRIHIFCEEAEYLFVLADRGEYVLPWTAFTVERPHQQRRLLERWKTATGS
jgi:hypothetical protein